MTSESPTPSQGSPVAQWRAKFDALPKDIREYLLIFTILMAMLGLTVLAAYINLGAKGNLTAALTIAIVKATLVVLYFMHVKEASRVTWVFASAAFLWLAIMIGMTMSDYATRGDTPGRAEAIPAVDASHLPQSNR